MNTPAGGKNVRKTLIKRYGADYWSRMGALGGKYGAKDGVIKGFATDPERARLAGTLGGKIGRRGKKLTPKERSAIREQFEYFQKQSDEQQSRLNSKYGVKRPW